MKTIYAKIDTSKIADYPRVFFGGKIALIQTESEAEKAVNFLLEQPILGFDTETRPSFKKGVSHQVALLQVSTSDVCFLFRLNKIGLPDCLVKLLSDKSHLKIGLSLKDDFLYLRKRTDFRVGKFVELQEFVKGFGIKDMSLQKLFANLFQQRISKSQRLSNWEAEELTESQQRYAATDAWACVRIYEELVKIKQSNDYTVLSIPCEPLEKVL
ncbi:MAG: 3'-5' exonuclease [Bacteroidaceae bacterium]